jgi:hypothetical protein
MQDHGAADSSSEPEHLVGVNRLSSEVLERIERAAGDVAQLDLDSGISVGAAIGLVADRVGLPPGAARESRYLASVIRGALARAMQDRATLPGEQRSAPDTAPTGPSTGEPREEQLLAPDGAALDEARASRAPHRAHEHRQARTHPKSLLRRAAKQIVRSALGTPPPAAEARRKAASLLGGPVTRSQYKAWERAYSRALERRTAKSAEEQHLEEDGEEGRFSDEAETKTHLMTPPEHYAPDDTLKHAIDPRCCLDTWEYPNEAACRKSICRGDVPPTMSMLDRQARNRRRELEELAKRERVETARLHSFLEKERGKFRVMSPAQRALYKSLKEGKIKEARAALELSKTRHSNIVARLRVLHQCHTLLYDRTGRIYEPSGCKVKPPPQRLRASSRRRSTKGGDRARPEYVQTLFPPPATER